MKRFVVFLVALTGLVTVASAQTAPAVNWKEKVVGQWAYAGTEEFGVVTPPDSTQAKDNLAVNADGTYKRMEKGKASNGTYKVDETAKTITFKDATGKSKMYYLKKSDPGVLIIEFQTPDLVRTRYKFTALQ
jgi:hypothetical protein